jgi:hypothetical protein
VPEARPLGNHRRVMSVAVGVNTTGDTSFAGPPASNVDASAATMPAAWTLSRKAPRCASLNTTSPTATIPTGSPIRLIATILDPELVSTSELAAVYHQRWEFESSLAEIETRQRGRYRVLARTVLSWRVTRSGRCC